MREQFRHLPSPEVYQAFAALQHVDSITVDPHKLGFLSFGCGAYVARNRAMTELISQRANYVFDATKEASADDYDTRSRHLGRYTLEGSKPGATTAAAWVTHRVLPLDNGHFSRLCAETARNCEYFFDHIEALRQSLAGIARVVLPFEPDTNLFCLAINPEGNDSLGRMNTFGLSIYAHLCAGEGVDMRSREFFGSRTLVQRSVLGPAVATRLIGKLGLDPATFVDEPDGSGEQAYSIFLLRHTLMNPWLLGCDQGLNYLDRYCRHLARLVRKEVEQLRGSSALSRPTGLRTAGSTGISPAARLRAGAEASRTASAQ